MSTDAVVQNFVEVSTCTAELVSSTVGKELLAGQLPRTISTMVKTLIGRGEPELVFDAELEALVPVGKWLVEPIHRASSRMLCECHSRAVDGIRSTPRLLQ